MAGGRGYHVTHLPGQRRCVDALLAHVMIAPPLVMNAGRTPYWPADVAYREPRLASPPIAGRPGRPLVALVFDGGRSQLRLEFAPVRSSHACHRWRTRLAGRIFAGDRGCLNRCKPGTGSPSRLGAGVWQRRTGPAPRGVSSEPRLCSRDIYAAAASHFAVPAGCSPTIEGTLPRPLVLLFDIVDCGSSTSCSSPDLRFTDSHWVTPGSGRLEQPEPSIVRSLRSRSYPPQARARTALG